MRPKTTEEASAARIALIREQFPDGLGHVSEAEVMTVLQETMEMAGIPADFQYAAVKLGRIVTVENEHMLSEEEMLEWEAAIDEYHLLVTADPNDPVVKQILAEVNADRAARGLEPWAPPVLEPVRPPKPRPRWRR